MTTEERRERIRYEMTLMLKAIEELCRDAMWLKIRDRKFRNGCYPVGKEYRDIERQLYPKCYRLSNKFLNRLREKGYALN